jgi:hypothetical protein
MVRSLAAIAVIAAAFALFYATARTPTPAPANAPAEAFSAARAMVDIAALAPTPHPIGSPANHRVRDILIARMTALGLSPRIQRDVAVERRQDAAGPSVGAGAVENLIGVLPGQDHSRPALLMMAHYDSVPGSPGAADDIASVASILEIVRALETQGRPARDVVVLFTDGEEEGRLGARAFFADDPLARHVGFVLNLDVRGGGGRALMFETGTDNGAAIDLYRRTAKSPFANALSVFVYRLEPNDTDFSIARDRGLPGLNYAFFGREFDYHAPSSTVAALDQGAVQHLGAEVLPTARTLAFSASLPPPAPDAAYGDFLGWFVIAYPPWAGWIVLAGAAGLVIVAATAARRAAGLTLPGVAAGFCAGALILTGSALALWLARLATGVAPGWLSYRPLLARFPAYEAGLALAGLAAILLVAAGVARLGLSRASGWIGVLASAVLAGFALQVAAPAIAPIVVWPLILAGAAAALTGAGTTTRRWCWAPAIALIVVQLGWLGVLFHALLQALDIPESAALSAWLAALSLWPLVSPRAPVRAAGFASGVIVLAAGLAVMAALRLTSPWSPRYPRAVEPVYLVEADAGRAWRAALIPPDAWTRQVLGADGGTVAPHRFPATLAAIPAAPAKPVPIPPSPTFTLSHTPDGSVELTVTPAPGASHLGLYLRASSPVSGMTLDGHPLPLLAKPGGLSRIYWDGPGGGFSLRFRADGPGRLDLEYLESFPAWPASARPLPPLPAHAMAWDRAGSTMAVGRRRLSW